MWWNSGKNVCFVHHVLRNQFNFDAWVHHVNTAIIVLLLKRPSKWLSLHSVCNGPVHECVTQFAKHLFESEMLFGSTTWSTNQLQCNRKIPATCRRSMVVITAQSDLINGQRRTTPTIACSYFRFLARFPWARPKRTKRNANRFKQFQRLSLVRSRLIVVAHRPHRAPAYRCAIKQNVVLVKGRKNFEKGTKEHARKECKSKLGCEQKPRRRRQSFCVHEPGVKQQICLYAQQLPSIQCMHIALRTVCCSRVVRLFIDSFSIWTTDNSDRVNNKSRISICVPFLCSGKEQEKVLF